MASTSTLSPANVVAGATSRPASRGPSCFCAPADDRQRLAQFGAGDRRQFVRIDEVVGGLAGGDQRRVVLEAQPRDQLERLELAQGVGEPLVDRADARDGLDPVDGRRDRDAVGERVEADEVDERDDRAVLEVEPARGLAVAPGRELAAEPERDRETRTRCAPSGA